MSDPTIGTQEQWQAQRDELAAKRRTLPWVAVENDYRFDTERGTQGLADLFDGRGQLMVYHFMFGPSYEAGCPVCTSIADTLAVQVPHLKAKDTTLILASRGPLAKLIEYRKRMGWDIDWVSSGGSDFNRDIGFLHTEEELQPFLAGEIPVTVVQNAEMCGTTPGGYVAEGPGLSVYTLADGVVYRTYVSTARGLELAMPYYALLDRTPKGRDEHPGTPPWLRRHDEYESSVAAV